MITRVTLAFLALSAAPLWADTPEITKVSVSKPDMGWHFDVTLLHPDTGWEHYADGWEVLDADGNRLGYRELHHPHVHEQPFTRSLRGVMIPDGVRTVFIRAHCSEHGWSDKTYKVDLPLGGGSNY